jgi:hypothetical protein
MWREMNAWWEYISHEIDVSNELDADINFPKIHLIINGFPLAEYL